MDHHQQFNLPQHLMNWKQYLIENKGLSIAYAQKLESQLLDKMDYLKQKNNLSLKEAYFVAQSRLGQLDLMQHSSQKTDLQTKFGTSFITGAKSILISIIVFYSLSFIPKFSILSCYPLNAYQISTAVTLSLSFFFLSGCLLYWIIRLKNTLYFIPLLLLKLAFILSIIYWAQSTTFGMGYPIVIKGSCLKVTQIMFLTSSLVIGLLTVSLSIFGMVLQKKKKSIRV